MPGRASARRRTEGVTLRHCQNCTAPDGACRCKPTYQAQVFSSRDGRTIRKSFKSLSEARAWRADTQTAVRKGTSRAPTRTTLADAAEDCLVAAKAGIARTRSGDPYKPSALRSYEEALRTKALPELGNLRLSSVDRVAVQDLVDRLVARGLAPSTVRNSVLPLRAIFRRAVARSEVVQNPTLGLSLPAVRGSRDRIARPEEARALIAAVPEGDRALWATALYAGLRRGELQALRWADVDLEAGLIRVERSGTRGRARSSRRGEPDDAGSRSWDRSAASSPPTGCASRAQETASRWVGERGGSPRVRPPVVRTRPGRRRTSSRSACTSVATLTPRT